MNKPSHIVNLLKLVRKDMDVNQHERPSDTTLEHKFKQGNSDPVAFLHISWAVVVVIVFITTYAISAYHAHCYAYSIQHYVNKFVSDLLLVGGFRPHSPVYSTNKSDHHNITDILLNVALNP